MRLISHIHARRDALRSERGFSMIVVIGVMAASSLFVAAAFSAANGDLPLTRDSQDRKQAYAAAEAGINFYQYHLNQDPDYWTRCTTVPAPNGTELNPVNQAWNGVGTDPRRWRNVPGLGIQYSIELLPANGNAQCTVGNQATMIQQSTGAFRVRATGRPRSDSKLRRTLVASFRRRSFLDFLYFTDFETVDPLAYSSSNQAQANSQCANKYRAQRTSWCSEIQFADQDQLNGPLHTNDDILTCGTPVFGRSASDPIEFSGPAPGWDAVCSGSPTFNGPVRANVKKLTMPSTNTTIETAAAPAYLFTGTTKIRFNGPPSNNMTVTRNYDATTNTFGTGGSVSNLALPANGVIYVRTGAGGCGTLIPPSAATYTEPRSCGNLYVSGTYTGSMTLAAKNDIIIKAPGAPVGSTTPNNPADGATNGNLVKAAGSDHVLGMIANNFVRVHHRVGSNCGSNQSPVMNNVTIDSAILSLAHSFVVDNWRCGAKLGAVTANGAIAQKYRGAVGTTAPSGYDKNYNYDDRLRYRSPPFFLEPIAASWGVVRSNEQVPAR